MPTMSAFVTSSQFLFYTDSRRVCELLSDSDSGTPIPLIELPTNATLLEILQDATQEVIEACLVGKRYTVAELMSLAADNQGGSVSINPSGDYVITGGNTVKGIGSSLRKLTAALAWGTLVDRRKYSSEEFSKLAPSWAMAQQKLELLRLGERIFQITGADEAGLPSVVKLGVDSDLAGTTIASKVGLFGTIALGNRGIGGNPYTGLR